MAINVGQQEFLSNVFGIRDITDTSKIIRLNASAISAGTPTVPVVRTISMADRDIDLDWLNQDVKNTATPTFVGLNSLDFIDFDISPGTPPGDGSEGRVKWNTEDKTLDITSGLGPVLQVGQEIWETVRNETGVQINDGQVVFVSGAASGRPLIELAKADSPVTLDRTIGVATMDIPDGTEGIVTTFGTVRDVDTSSFSPGDVLYVSGTVAGGIVNVQPIYPKYIMRIGCCQTSNATTGKIQVNVIGRSEDILENGWNGGFLESVNLTIAVDTGVIVATLANDDPAKNLTMNFSDGFTILDTTTSPLTINLTAGSADIPQDNFIYILQSTKALTISTSDWPITEHIKVSRAALRTVVITDTDGALRNQNWNDHVAEAGVQGHIMHIGERIRQDDAKWHSGAEGSVAINTATSPDEVTVASTQGTIYQLHRQIFPAQDMATGDDIHVVNNLANPLITVTDLNTQILDALGNSLANSSFSFVVWGIMNKSGQASHLMLNLPTGSYLKNRPDDAVSDASNSSVYDIPAQFRGVGFLIARFTFILQASGLDWTLHDTQDLRGFTPNTSAGGGAGGGGVSTFLGLTDTPSAYSSQAGKIVRVNDAETALEFSAITETGGVVNFSSLDIINIGDITFTSAFVGGSTGVKMTAASGVLTLAGVGGTNNNTLLFNLESSASKVSISSSVGELDFGNLNLRTSGDILLAGSMLMSGAFARFFVAVGSLTAPSLSFNNLQNAGFYLAIGNTQVRLVQGGKERMALNVAQTVFNLGNNDLDVVIRGTVDNSLLHANAGTNTLGVGTNTPAGKFHVDQSIINAAIPVLYLDQADVSEEMIEFNTTIGVGNAIEAVGAKSLTTTHFIKITLPGALTRYIPVGTIA